MIKDDKDNKDKKDNKNITSEKINLARISTLKK